MREMTTISDQFYNEFNHSAKNLSHHNESRNYITSFNTSNGSDTLRDYLLNSKPDFIQVVPAHWLDQPPPVPDTQLAISIILLFICVPANISQILVVYAYSRRFSLRTASNKLLVSLLLADFLLLFNCYQTIIQNFLGEPIFGVIGCDFYGFNASVAALAEIWSLAFVSFDRFLAIYFPLDRRKRITKSQANLIILIVWASAILFSIFPLAGWNKFVSEAYFMGCAFDSFSTAWSDRSYILTLLVLAWLIPLVSNILFYTAMLHRVQNSDFQYYVKKIGRSECYSMFNIDNRVQMEMRLAKMACTILLVWFVAWTPYAVMSFWVMFFNGNGLTPMLGLLPTICTKGSAFANALLYGLRLPKFKAEVKSIGKAIIPSLVSKYFSSIKESSQCSKVCFNQVSSKTPDTWDTTQDSSNSPYHRHSTKKGPPTSIKSLDPPNLVRLESISPALTPAPSRPSKLFFRTRKCNKRRSERRNIDSSFETSCASPSTEKTDFQSRRLESNKNGKDENRQWLKSTLILKNCSMKRKTFKDVENGQEQYESIALMEMKKVENESTQTETKKCQVVATIHNESPCSKILEGSFVDIYDTDTLEPNDFGIDDIPYIDQE